MKQTLIAAIRSVLHGSTGVLRAHNRKCVCRVISLILMQSDTHISMTSHTAHTFSIFYKHAAGLSQLVAVRHTHFHDVTHGTDIFHFLQIRCRAVPARCRPSTKHLMLMPIFGYRFHFAVKVRCCCCCRFILMQSDTHISMTSHTAHTFSVMRSQDACDLCLLRSKQMTFCLTQTLNPVL